MSIQINQRVQSFNSVLPKDTAVEVNSTDAKVATAAKLETPPKPSKPLSSYAIVKFTRDTILLAPRVVVSLLTAISSLATLILGGVANALLPEKVKFSVIEMAGLQARTAAIGFGLAFVKPVNDVWIGIRDMMGQRDQRKGTESFSTELARDSIMWVSTGTTQLKEVSGTTGPKTLMAVNKQAALIMGAGSMIKASQRTDLESNLRPRSAPSA